MDIKIDKGIPIPDQNFKGENSKSFLYRKAFSEMEVGDSFVIEVESPYDKMKARSILHKVSTYSGIKCTTRTMEDDNLRVWRIM